MPIFRQHNCTARNLYLNRGDLCKAQFYPYIPAPFHSADQSLQGQRLLLIPAQIPVLVQAHIIYLKERGDLNG